MQTITLQKRDGQWSPIGVGDALTKEWALKGLCEHYGIPLLDDYPTVSVEVLVGVPASRCSALLLRKDIAMVLGEHVVDDTHAVFRAHYGRLPGQWTYCSPGGVLNKEPIFLHNDAAKKGVKVEMSELPDTEVWTISQCRKQTALWPR